MRRLLSLALLLLPTTFGIAAESSSATSGSSKSQKSSSESAPKTTAPAPKDDSKTTRKPTSTKEGAKDAAGDKASLSEDAKFTAARKAAYEDPKVAELRAKADSAKNDETANKAMRLYLKALYSKMRALDPSLEERINLTEAAALRALPQP